MNVFAFFQPPIQSANESTVAAKENVTMEPVAGMNLGTTFLCVSVWRNGKAEVVRNKSGNRTTPSYVSFTKDEVLIGETAQDLIETNSENTIFNVKRLM